MLGTITAHLLIFQKFSKHPDRRMSAILPTFGESGGIGWTPSNVKRTESARQPRIPTPPGEPVYLWSGYPASIQGGTVIAADVRDREEHTKRLASPDDYRTSCRICGRAMHSHATRQRTIVDELPIVLRRYRCPDCGGVVTVLPGFIARNLWQRTGTVEEALLDTEEPRSRVPERTRRRWRARARTAATTALQVLSALRIPALLAVVKRVGLDGSRGALLDAFRPLAGPKGPLAALTNLLNLALRGLRMM